MTPYIEEKNNFSSETMETRKKCHNIFQILGRRELSTKNSITSKKIL